MRCMCVAHKRIRQIIPLLLTFALLACGGGKDDMEMLLAAKDHLAQNRMRAAALELRNALQQNPENAEARYMLGQINLDVGDTAAAEKEFRRAAQAGWPEEQAVIGIARSLVDRNALQAVLDEIVIKPDYPPTARANLYGLHAMAVAGLGDLEKAAEFVSRGREIESDALYVLKASAQLHLQAGDYDKADRVLVAALSEYPDNQELLLVKAATALKRDQPAKAAELLGKVMVQDPAGIVTAYGRKARLELAELEIRNGNLDQAETVLAPLFKQAPTDPLTNYVGGLLAYEQGNLNLADERLLKVLKFAPDHAQTQFLYGAVSYAQQEYEQAAYYLGSYINQVPGNLDARKLLGRTYILLGQHDQARETLQQGVNDSSEDAELLALVGLSQIKSGDAISGIEDLENAVKAAPESPSLRNELAKAYISAGQMANAVRILEENLAKDGGSLHTEALIVYAHLKGGRVDKAIEAVLNMVRKEGENVDVLTLAGSVYAANGDKPEARRYLTRALAIDAGSLSATMALARLEQLEGNEAEAERLYRRIAGPEHKAVEPLVALAHMAEMRGDTQGMLDWLEKARAQVPDDIKARAILAEYYLRANQPEKADIYVNEAIKISPQENGLRVLRGRVLLAQGQYNEALVTLKRLADQAPDSAVVSLLLGETYLKLGQVDAARNQLDRALEAQPYNVAALALMAGVELQSGRREQALDYARQIQQIQPDHYIGYELAGDVLVLSNSNTDAELAYSKAWERKPSALLAIKLSEVAKRSGQAEKAVVALQAWLAEHPDDADVLQFLGATHQDAGQEDEAIAIYERLLKIRPDNLVALNNLAWLYSKRKDPRALSHAEQAYRSKPDDANIKDTYGWVLVQQGQVDKGRRLLEQAMQQLSDVAEVRYHYAMALLKSGESEKANQMLDQLIQSGQPFEGREDALIMRKMQGQIY